MTNVLLSLAAAGALIFGTLALPDTAEAQRRGRGDRDWDGRRWDGDGRDWGRPGRWGRWNDGFYGYNPYGYNYWGGYSYYPRYYYSYPYTSYYSYPYYGYSYPYYRYSYAYPGIGFSVRF